MTLTSFTRKWSGRALVAAMLLSGTAISSQAETLKVVMQSGVRITDPILTTAFITRDLGYMVFDTLLGVDHDFTVKPQMADWKVSGGGKLYTFTLRDGLRWHDGTSVTAEDCIASIKRWVSVDGTGMPLMTMVSSINKVDDKTFTIALNRPTTLLLLGLSKLSSRPPFMTPRRHAETPATECITQVIGSGPFKIVAG